MSNDVPASAAPTLIGDPESPDLLIPEEGLDASAYLADEPEDLTGQVLNDRYRLVKKLGEGGMAEVYLAEHTAIGKRCAIKLMFAEHCHKQILIDRFLQEARAASAIEHENVVEITDFGRAPNGSVYFSMEYLAGEDLADTLASEHRLPWYRVRGIGVQLCQALAAAHEKGIIHRDLKPENCFRITRAGNPDFIKVLDFGIAKILSDAGEGGKGLTQTGSIFGTPEYMSPEQAAGEKVDHRADIYSLGVILYELLTGRAPFSAESYMGVLAKHMFEAPIAPRAQAPDADIPVDVEAIILKAMQKDRDLRFQDMHEFAAAIESVGTGAPPVAVVDEELPRPTVETVMNFAEATVTELHRQPSAGVEPRAEESDELEVVQGRRKRLLVVAAAALVAATLLVSMWFFGGSDPPPKEPSPTVENVVVATPDLPDEKPSPPVMFSIDVTTNTDAEVLDADDREVLGRTNREGLKLPQRDEPYRFVLVAEGHQELEVEVLADGDKKIEFKLARKRSHKRRTKKKSKKKSTTKKGSGLRLKDPYAK